MSATLAGFFFVSRFLRWEIHISIILNRTTMVKFQVFKIGFKLTLFSLSVSCFFGIRIRYRSKKHTQDFNDKVGLYLGASNSQKTEGVGEEKK